MKILTIIGARPQFIKAATLSRVVASLDDVEEVIVHTGQHFDVNMSAIFFAEMNIPTPDYNLGIASLSHGAMTGRMLERIEKIIIDEKPDWVLVYGDTNSTLAGALAASKLHIKVAHVEAGLRSYDMRMPEEQNRILTDRVSSVLFCPSVNAVRNLHSEGYSNIGTQIVEVGDIMFDAALYYGDRARTPDWLGALGMTETFILATVHRAENTDNLERFVEIIAALNKIHVSTPVVMPLHPRTRQVLHDQGLELNVHVVDPVSYLEMVCLLKSCSLVLSDSGGVQKEAYYFKKSCLILRDQTEWPELVECGANKIVKANYGDIIEATLDSDKVIDFSHKFYGSGDTAQKIIDYLLHYKA